MRLEGALFVLVAALNERGHDRLGFVASRRLGSAVERNGIKRRLREAFRVVKGRPGPACDLVVLPKRDLLRSAQREVEGELRARLQRLTTRLEARLGPGSRH